MAIGSRFRRHRPRGGGLHPAAIIAICLAAAILLTLTMGNLLYYWLDDDTYHALIGEGGETKPPVEEIFHANVRRVNAYPFALGDDVDEILGTPAVSVPINRTDGSLCYSSAVASYQGRTETPDVPLGETLGELCSYVTHVSGVFTPTAFAKADPALFYAAALEDAALLREFTGAGANELLLCGLPLTLENLDRVTTYLRAVKSAAPKIPLGVAVPLSVAQTEGGWEILSTVLTVADFCALDLSAEAIEDEEPAEGDISPAAQALLANADYWLRAYDMRILLAADQTALLGTLEAQMHQNYQVLHRD